MSDGGDGRGDEPRGDGRTDEVRGEGRADEPPAPDAVEQPGSADPTDEHRDDPAVGPSAGEPRRGGQAHGAAGDAEERDGEGGTGDDPSVAAIFGARPEDAPPRPSIDPERPELEHVLFVLLGVTVGLFAIWRAVVVFAP